MAFESLQGPVGALTEADLVAQELGINNWQLTQGSYNGVTFHVVKSTLARLNDDFNPAAGVIDSTTSLIGGSTNNGNNNNLPYGTTTVSTAITDITNRKLAIFAVPNAKDVFESMGWQGDIYVIRGIIFGAQYANALGNILNKFLNDNNAAPEQRNKLVHPIKGPIPGRTYLVTKKEVHNPNLWRSVMYEFVFRAEAAFGTLKEQLTSNVSAINSKISAILAISTAVLNTWGDIKALQISFSSSGNNYEVRQQLIKNQAKIKTSINASLTSAKLLVSNLKPTTYNNVSLTQTPTTPTTSIPSYFYFINNMTPSDVNSLINNNNNIIQDTIDTLNASFNTNAVFSTISNLITLQADLIQLATLLLNSYYGSLQQYIVPYGMDLTAVCVINNLNYDTQSSLIYLLNRGVILNANYIPKGTILNLPLSQSRSPRSEIVQ